MNKALSLAGLITRFMALFCAAITFAAVYALGGRAPSIPLASAAAAAALIFTLWYLGRFGRRRRRALKEPFPEEWEVILEQKMDYYRHLKEPESGRFRKQIQLFLAEHRVVGVDTEIDDTVRVLAAASAVIPVFRFPDWEYATVSDVLVYPTAFNEDFETGSGGILGMVGGDLGGAVLLSKRDLVEGFKKSNDNRNVGVHEFAHKVDQGDGCIDGIPAALADKPVLKRWKAIMAEEMARMDAGRSDINPYGLTNEAEFFAVVSEYFFENAASMEKKHPKLYRILQAIYKQDTKRLFRTVVKKVFRSSAKKVGRNAPCPCGSGKKFKYCCLGKIKR